MRIYLLVTLHFFFFLRRAIPGYAQDILLALCSDITFGNAQETIYDIGDQTWVSCLQDKCNICCSISSAYLNISASLVHFPTLNCLKLFQR